MYSEKRVWPKTNPWGTPHVNEAVAAKELPSHTEKIP